MNYHKKILSVGFKRNKEVIIISSYKKPFLERINGLRILTLKKYKEELPTQKAQWNQSILTIHEMNGLTISDSDKLFTYFQKISEKITIYITIKGLHYYCFIDDKDSPDTMYRGYGCIIEKTNIKISSIDILKDDFWKTIISKLPINIKREVLLKQIL